MELPLPETLEDAKAAVAQIVATLRHRIRLIDESHEDDLLAGDAETAARRLSRRRGIEIAIEITRNLFVACPPGRTREIGGWGQK